MYKACKEILDKLENEGMKINHEFKFPPRRPLTKRLKDVLETEVDEKYYLSEKQLASLLASNYDQNKRFYKTDGVSPTISTMGGGQRQPKIVDDTYGYETKPREYNGVSPTLRSGRQGLRVVEPFIVASRGRGENNEQHLEPRGDGVTNTITSVQKDNYVARDYRIRKLTPLECWRLMSFDDADFRKAEKVNSNTQLYKQAGNSIVVSVLEPILAELLDSEKM